MTILMQSGDSGRVETPPFRQRRPRAAATTEFGAALDTLDIPQSRAAKLFRVSARHVRRWRSGARRPPPGVAVVVRLMMAGKVKIADVEQAAVPANDDAKGKPPAPLRAAPAPEEQSASARAKTAALAICELTPEICHWPLGDPQCLDFHFCSKITTRPPYCEEHRRVAYLAPRTGDGHGVRVGFIAHGRQPRPQQAPAHDRP